VGLRKSRRLGRELNVGAILEGSVRQAGGAIRVTAQLIDVNSDEHLGGPLDPANTLKRYYSALSPTGLPRVTFHDLRHTATTLMASEGIPVHLIQAVLGHANSRTTMDIYTHVLSTDLDVVRDRMDAAFSRRHAAKQDAS